MRDAFGGGIGGSRCLLSFGYWCKLDGRSAVQIILLVLNVVVRGLLFISLKFNKSIDVCC